MEWPTPLDEYEKLIIRMSTPRVMIDNASCCNATRVIIDSGRKHGILLEAVQILTDLNLSIKKANISSDGPWFMDVFHVTDLNGEKLAEESVVQFIEQSLETVHYGGSITLEGLTALELTGTDRVGLLSEVFAVLSNLHCSVVDAKVWTHNGRMASLVYLKDNDSDTPIQDSDKLVKIRSMLNNVLQGNSDIRSAKISLSSTVTHNERRLHQMMFADRDYEKNPMTSAHDDAPIVSVQNYLEKDYSSIYIQCKDRNKLLFDVVCTLTDMEYVVFHATVDTSTDKAKLEFFIRHKDGSPISSEAEKERVILCLQAAIERRSSQGVKLELCTDDRNGLLADVMRTFRENGLNVTKAEISTTKDDTAMNIFYVTDSVGNNVDPMIIESVRQKVGLSNLQVKEELPLVYNSQRDGPPSSTGGGAMLLSLGSMVKRNLFNLGLIRSYS